jgi:hypothetical protein
MTTTNINSSTNSSSGIKLTGDDILNIMSSVTLTDTDSEAVKWNLGTAQGAGTGITLNNAGTIISPAQRVVDQTAGPTPAGKTSFTLNNSSPTSLLQAYKDVFRAKYGNDGGSIVVNNVGVISAGVGNPTTGNRDFDIEEYAKVGNVTGFSTFALTNASTGTIKATDDAIRITTNSNNASNPTLNPTFTGFITIDNLGTIQSTGVNVNGAFSSGQALDFDNVNATAAGQIIITNGSLGDSNAFIISVDNDAIRPGNNGIVLNYGTIIGGQVFTSADYANPTKQGGNDGVSATYDELITVTNYGLIEGSKSGVYGERDPATETLSSDSQLPDGTPTLSSDIIVYNEAGATIIGQDGKGVGADFGNIYNAGTIIGEDNTNLLRGDGDGIDVNFTVYVTNAAGGVIDALGSEGSDDNGRKNVADGLAIGGGTVYNDGTIYSANNGVTVNNDGNPDGSRSGNADLVLTNDVKGVILAENGYAIRSENKAGTDESNLPAVDYDTVVNYGAIISDGTIPNFAGTFEITTYNTAAPYVATLTPDPNVVGTIEGQVYTSTADAGSIRFTQGDGSAIQLGEGNDILTNYGTIIAADGKAINLEGGNNTLNLYAGADVSGIIDGGLGGTNTLNLFTPNGAGNNPGATTGTLSQIIDFQTLNVEAGTWTLEDSETFASVSIASGASLLMGPHGTLVSNGFGGNLSFSGTAGALVVEGGQAPTGIISGFGPGDTIVLAGVPYEPHQWRLLYRGPGGHADGGCRRRKIQFLDRRRACGRDGLRDRRRFHDHE